MDEKKDLTWSCPKCGLIIKSPYPNQFKYNKEQHEKSHEKKPEDK